MSMQRDFYIGLYFKCKPEDFEDDIFYHENIIHLNDDYNIDNYSYYSAEGLGQFVGPDVYEKEIVLETTEYDPDEYNIALSIIKKVREISTDFEVIYGIVSVYN